MIDTIELIPIDLKKQKPTDVACCKVVLYESALEYVLEFYADEAKTDDEEMLKVKDSWVNVYNHFHIVAAKERISGVEKSYQPIGDFWLVAIFVEGFARDICLYFETDEKATEIMNRIVKFLYD